MSKNQITTGDIRKDENEEFKDTTGEDFGTTRPLHTMQVGSDPFGELVQMALWGSLPSPNYDKIIKLEIDSDTFTYTFSCAGANQFVITVSDATTNPVATVTDTTDLLTETLIHLLTETNDNIIKE